MRIGRVSALVALVLALGSPVLAAPRPDRGATLGQLLQRARSEGSPAPVDELLRGLARVRDPLVRKFHLSALLLQKTPMTRQQRRTVISMVRDARTGVLPRRPPVPAEGTIEVRYNIGAEFFDDSVQALVSQGFQFSDNPDGDGMQARRGRLHVILDTGADNLLRHLRDPKVHAVIYSGHSQLGAVVENAVRDGLVASGDAKLVAMLQCKGIQTLPLLASAMPNAHVLTTVDYSYSLSDQQFAHALLEGLERNESYPQIRSRIKREQKTFLFPQRANYLFPDRVALLGHTDFDRNGRLDAEQLASEQAAFATLTASQRRGATRLLSGVHYLRSMNAYYAEELPGAVFTRAQSATQVRAIGVEAGDGSSVVRIHERKENEQTIVEVALDQRFATADPPFIAAATVYELQLHLQRSLLGETGDRGTVRALAFAGEYLNRMFPGQAGERALARLLQHKRLPAVTLQSLPSGVHALSESSIDALARRQ
jgi:hypothetical protein